MTCIFFYADDSAATKLNQILESLTERIQIMANTLDDLITKAAAQTTTLASLGAFVEGLQAEIRKLKLSPVDQTKIDALFATLAENDERIAEAFVENVPPVEPPVEPVNPI